MEQDSNKKMGNFLVSEQVHDFSKKSSADLPGNPLDKTRSTWGFLGKNTASEKTGISMIPAAR